MACGYYALVGCAIDAIEEIGVLVNFLDSASSGFYLLYDFGYLFHSEAGLYDVTLFAMFRHGLVAGDTRQGVRPMAIGMKEDAIPDEIELGIAVLLLCFKNLFFCHNSCIEKQKAASGALPYIVYFRKAKTGRTEMLVLDLLLLFTLPLLKFTFHAFVPSFSVLDQ